MSSLPTVLASSVIRGTRVGESHGGLYLVDLERGAVEQKLDWNTTEIDIAGRGGDRGLRGIAFDGTHILVAANASLLFLRRDFSVAASFTNPFLAHCHEICVADARVFLTATGFDSVLIFDLRTRSFIEGWHLGAAVNALNLRRFDPRGSEGPPPGHRFHINSITAHSNSVFFSGLNTPGLVCVDGEGTRLAAPLPPGTHNAQLFAGGVLYNDTAAARVCYVRGGKAVEVPVPDFDAHTIINLSQFSSEQARPRFARGLCTLPNGMIAGGSSPSTISVYDLARGLRVKQVNVSMDVRNAIHGLAVWPF